MKLKYMLRGIGLGAILMAAIMYFVYGKSQAALSDDEIKLKARELGMMTVNEFQEKELNSLKDKLPNLSDIKVDEEAETSTVENNVTDTSSTTSNTPSEESGETGSTSDEGNKTSEEGTTAEDNTGTAETGNSEAKPAETEPSETGTAQTEPSETGTAEAGTSTDGNSTVSETKTSDTQNSNTETTKSKSGDTKNKKAAKKAKPKPKQVKEAPKPSVTYGKVSFTVSVGMTSERVSASLKALGIIDDSAKFNRYLVSNGYATRIKVGTVELQAGQSYAEIASKLVK